MPELPTGTVTFLFTDIEGSTALWEQHRDAMRQALVRHDELVDQIVAEHHGHLVRPRGEGDSRFAVFARATDAVTAAVALQQALYDEQWPTPTPLRVRMALHTGEADLREGDYYGSAVNRCARLRAVAHGGQTLVSLATQELARDALPTGAQLQDLGVHHLNDLNRPEQIFQLVIPDLPVDFPPLKSLDARPHNLPVQRDPLLGRECEVAEVVALLRRPQVGLVTLTGSGGTGKTRLGLQVAAELLDDIADGVWFVDLAPITDPALLPSTIAQTLDVKDVAGQSVTQTLKTYLGNKQVLLLLDNFEQIVSAAPLLTDLLGTAPNLKLLVTSREVLHLYGEHEYPVPPLAVPDSLRPGDMPLPLDLLSQYAAIALFLQRARAARPEFQMTNDNAVAVAELCIRLDGLPLAIELAAARAKVFTPQALLARLDNRLKLLSGGARDRAARQQTLRGAIDWSYNLLNADEQTLFARMGVFVGGCTLEGIEAVCTTPSELSTDLLDIVASLVDKSLVRQLEGAHGEPRFSMFETIREYALERLAESGEAAALQRSQALYVLAIAQETNQDQLGPAGGIAVERLSVELDNIRAALRWAIDQSEAQLAHHICAALEIFWVNSALNEGLEWLDRVLALGPAAHSSPGPAAAWGMLMEAAGYVVASTGDTVRAGGYFMNSLAAFREVGDGAGMGVALRGLGYIAMHHSEYDAAQAYIEESLAHCREVQQGMGIAFSLYDLGHLAYVQGNLARAESLLGDSLTHFQHQGNKLGLGRALLSLGHVARAQRQLDQARTYYRASLVAHWQPGYIGFTAPTLEGLAGVASAEGHGHQAARLFGAAEAARGTMRSALWLLPYERANVDRDVAAARAQLDAAAWEAAWAEGRMMTLEQAIAYALEEPDASRH